MKITVVHPDDLGPAELDRWRAYQRATASLANPFLSPEFVVAAGRVRPHTRVAVLTESGGPVGFFPFERASLGVGLPVAPGLNDMQGLIHAPELEWDMRDLLRACRLTVWEFDHLTEGQLPVAAAGKRYMSPIMDLRGGFDAYRQRVEDRSGEIGDQKQSWSEMPRKARRLTRQVGALRFVAQSHDVALLHMLMAWKSAQYQRSGTYDRFARGSVVGLVHELLAGPTASFAAELDALYAGDELLAASLSLRADAVMASWFSAYDPSFARFSPGMLQRWHSLQSAASCGVDWVSLGRGPEPYKQIVKTGDEAVYEGQVGRTSPVAAACRIRRESTQRLRTLVVGSPALYAIAEPIRRYAGLLDAAVRRLASR